MSTKKKKPKISPFQLRHAQVLDVVLSSVLGAIPYAKTAVLVLEFDPNLIEKVPFVGIKKRGAPMDKEALQCITILLRDYLAAVEKEMGVGKHGRQKDRKKRN